MKGKQRFGAAKRKSGTATAMWSRNRQAEENGSPIRNPRLTGPDAGNGGRAMKAGSPRGNHRSSRPARCDEHHDVVLLGGKGTYGAMACEVPR